MLDDCSVQEGGNTGEYTITFPSELGTVMALLLPLFVSLPLCLCLYLCLYLCLSVCHQPAVLDDCSVQDGNNTGECTITFLAKLGAVLALCLSVSVSVCLCLSLSLCVCLCVCLQLTGCRVWPVMIAVCKR